MVQYLFTAFLSLFGAIFISCHIRVTIRLQMRFLRYGMKLDVLSHKRGNEIITVIVIRLIINDARLFGAITSALKFNRS